MSEIPLSHAESHEYWMNRHKRYFGKWQSVGYTGGSGKVNKAFYACRRRALCRALGHHRIGLSGLRVLDVGCGTGVFSQFYYAFGAEVCGIDISADAVAYCNALSIGTFRTASAGKVASVFQGPFDIIHCFDVLYHLTDGPEWEAALEGFRALSHPDTLWMLTEFHVPETTVSARHLVKRSIGEYRTQLAKHGRFIMDEAPLYWVYSAFPKLSLRFPFLILRAEPIGSIAKLLMTEYVALWLVGSE